MGIFEKGFDVQVLYRKTHSDNLAGQMFSRVLRTAQKRRHL